MLPDPCCYDKNVDAPQLPVAVHDLPTSDYALKSGKVIQGVGLQSVAVHFSDGYTEVPQSERFSAIWGAINFYKALKLRSLTGAEDTGPISI